MQAAAAGARRRPARARHRRVRVMPSTSRSAAVPAPTSAARRPRSSTRSRASAASRGPSRRSRVQVGLFGKPTVVNNVETLVNVLDILHRGCGGVGGDRHRGIDGHAAVLPVGPRRAARALRAAIRRHARRGAGPRRWRRRRAAAAGDPARRRGRHVRRARVPRPAADVRGRPRGRPHARLRRRHGPRRHGRPARSRWRRIATFFRGRDRCGQCVPCRVGTVRQRELLQQLCGRAARPRPNGWRCLPNSVR